MIQVAIENFVIQDISPIPFGQNSTAMMLTVDAGTYLDVVVRFGNMTLDTAYINDNGFGLTLVHSYNYFGHGYYTVHGSVWNSVSPVQNFTTGVWVDYMITNLTITVDRLFVPVGEEMTTTVQMNWCSRFNTSIDFGDGIGSRSLYTELLLAPENVTDTYIYASPGLFIATVAIQNPVDNYTEEFAVHVQYPVRNLESNTISPQILVYGTPTYVPFNITFLGGVPPATDATLTVDYQDGTIDVDPFNVTDNSSGIFPLWHPYNDAGTYNVSLNVSNLVSWEVMYEVVEVDEVIYVLEFLATPVYIITHDFAELVASMVGGSRATCYINPGDGSATVSPACSRTQPANISHQYSVVGVFHPNVYANNSLSYQLASSAAGPVIVQNPVTGFAAVSVTKVSFIGPPYTSGYDVTLNFELLFDNTQELATNASFQVDFGDGYVTAVEPVPTTSEAANFYINQDLIKSFSHTYSKGGNYSIDITIWNLVSQEVYSDSFDIYETISNLQLTVFDYNSFSGVKRVGGGSNMDYFAQENFVWFQASHDRGSHVTYSWDYGDGFSESIYYTDYSLYTYSDIGTYSITLNAANIIGSTDLTITIYVHRSCNGIAISANTPRAKNTTFEFPVYPGNIATDGCYMIDFEDDTAEPSRYQFFGDFAYCASIAEWSGLFQANVDHFWPVSSSDLDAKKYLYLNPSTSSTGSISTSTSSSTGTMTTTSTSTSTTGSTVSSSWASTISSSTSTSTSTTTTTEASTTTTLPPTTTTLSIESVATWNETIRTKYMQPGLYNTKLTCKNRVSEETATWVTGVTKGPCWWPYVNVTSANVCKPPFCDDEYPDMRTHYRSEKLVVYSDVKINCTATKIAYFWWRVFLQNVEWGNETEVFDLKGADYFSIGARNLILNSNTLDYGLYRFSLNASMDELMGMDTLDNVYLRIIPTPLVVGIVGGEFVMRRWGDYVPMEIDGGFMSYDPDMEDPNDKTGIEFIWLCRRLCEEWPEEYFSDYTVKTRMPANLCEYQDPSDRGCNKVDGFDSSGW